MKDEKMAEPVRTVTVELTDREARSLVFAASMQLQIFGDLLDEHRSYLTGEEVWPLESAGMKIEAAMVGEWIDP